MRRKDRRAIQELTERAIRELMPMTPGELDEVRRRTATMDLGTRICYEAALAEVDRFRAGLLTSLMQLTPTQLEETRRRVAIATDPGAKAGLDAALAEVDRLRAEAKEGLLASARSVVALGPEAVAEFRRERLSTADPLVQEYVEEALEEALRGGA